MKKHCVTTIISISFFFWVTGFAFASNTPAKTNLIEGCVGEGSTDGCVKSPYPPGVIVMEGKLIVFYILNNAEKEKTWFYPATMNAEGKLDWHMNDPFYHEPFDAYAIDLVDDNALNSVRFSPYPILYDNKLYLFGREDNPNRIVYNSVDNYNALMKGFWNKNTPHYHQSSLGQTQPANDKDQISLINFKDPWVSDSPEKLLMAFYWKDKGPVFYYSLCKPEAESDSGELHCDVDEGDDTFYNYDGPPHLANEVKYAFNQNYLETTLYIRRQDSGQYNKILHSYRLNNEVDGWFRNDGPEFKVAREPMGSAQVLNPETGGYTNHIYYIHPDSNKIHKAVGQGESWQFTFMEKNAKNGVKTIVYNNRIYTFYIDPKDNTMKYFSDVTTP